MSRLSGPHPAVTAFLLGAGGFLTLYFGWQRVFPLSSGEQDYWNSDLMQVLGWSLTVAGVLMWLTGGIFFGRDRGLHWFPALCLHLLPVLGLILILRIGKSPSRHAASVRKNRRLDDKTARRTYRPLKPLY